MYILIHIKNIFQDSWLLFCPWTNPRWLLVKISEQYAAPPSGEMKNHIQIDHFILKMLVQRQYFNKCERWRIHKNKHVVPRAFVHII